MRLGVAVPFAGVDAARSVRIAAAAESFGYADAWSSEIGGGDGLTPLAALSQRTETMRLGVALLPAATRPPALLAMSAATLQDLSGGRFVLGLGASSRTIVEDWMGGDWGLPLTRLRETVEATRLALSGERIPFEGRTLRMDFRREGVAVEVPIMLGALGPQALRAAGEIGDGLLLTFAAAESIPTLVDQVRRGRGDRGMDGFEVVCRVPVAVGEPDPTVEAALRRFVAGYAATPLYNRFLRAQGFEREAEAIRSAWREGRRDAAVAAVGPDLLDTVTVAGPPERCAERLRRYATGVDTLIVSPVNGATEPGERAARAEADLRALAVAYGAG
jgi:probable F420-dependent oxidoreductase